MRRSTPTRDLARPPHAPASGSRAAGSPRPGPIGRADETRRVGATRATAIALALGLAACAGSGGPAAEGPGAEPAASAPADAPPLDFVAEVRAALVDHEQLPLADEYLNWSPLDCRAAPPAGVAWSESEDDGTHGRKLYVLHVKDARAYLTLSLHLREGVAAIHDIRRPPPDREILAPVGQVLVKRSFVPVHLPDAAPEDSERAETLGFSTVARDRNGELYLAGDPGPLFVMLKLDPETPDTDRGWVYATATPEGEVTASGRLASCMRCHQRTQHDRLFGPKW